MGNKLATLVLLACFLQNCHSSRQLPNDQGRVLNDLSALPDSLSILQNQGIDYFASGNEPVNWNLRMDMDGYFYFTASGAQEVKVTAVKELPASQVNGRTFKAGLAPQILQVTIFNVDCEKTELTEGHNRHVELLLDGKKFIGCGRYLYDKRLKGNWRLESIDNEMPEPAQKPSSFPAISLDILKQSMNGYDGCNRVNAKIAVEGDRIRFGNFSGTRMACAGAKTPALFSTMLSNKLVDYKISNDRLMLHLENDSKLVFTREP